MANSLVLAPPLARLALASLRDATVFGGLVYRDAEREFIGGAGSVVTIRRPATFIAKAFVRANGIEIQDVVETTASINLDTILDVSAEVTAEELTLSFRDIRAQVVDPALQAIADGTEAALVAEVANITQSVTLTDADPHSTFIDAKTLLDQSKTPSANRSLLLDPVTAGKWLKSDKGSRADARGDSGRALADAFVGRVAGFNLYTSNALPAGTSVAFHRDAFALVSRALALPNGGDTKASETFEGYAVRLVWDYAHAKKMDVLSVDTLVGTSVLRPESAVVITDAV